MTNAHNQSDLSTTNVNRIMRNLAFPLILCFAFTLQAAADDVDGRIYGRVHTTDGEVFEGIIRWDRNEASWVDLLNGTKVMYDRSRSSSGGRRIEIFGVTVYEDNTGSSRTKTSGIRFGHIKTLKPLGNDSALLTLQSGEEVEFKNGSTDIGTDIREIIVEDAERGEVELKWRDIESIDFMQAPQEAYSEYGERIFGTLITRSGYEFTGFICWDVDEVLSTDMLDGNDDSRRRRKIRFGNIESISRNSSSSARVVLTNGEDVVLRGTNDVNHDNNGILVLDPQLGQVEVDWDDFDEVVFSVPDYVPTYSDFTRSGFLEGVVYSRDGDTFEGLIRWDNDESSGWEMLNGEMEDLVFDIEFGKIRTIERISSRGAEVVLFDGRSFELRDSNDVNDDNNGIYILDANGNETKISWRDFDRVVFDKR